MTLAHSKDHTTQSGIVFRSLQSSAFSAFVISRLRFYRTYNFQFVIHRVASYMALVYAVRVSVVGGDPAAMWNDLCSLTVKRSLSYSSFTLAIFRIPAVLNGFASVADPDM